MAHTRVPLLDSPVSAPRQFKYPPSRSILNMTAKEQIEHLTVQLKQALEELRKAQERIVELERQKTPTPSFVKANAKKPKSEEKKPHVFCEAQYNHAGQHSVPTQIEEHRIVACPDCHLRLGDISLARVREVIDVPPPPRVEVTHHRIFKGWCSGYQRWHEAPMDFSEQTLGQGRIRVRLASIIAYLRTVMRLPLRQIQAVLQDLHGFQVSLGEMFHVKHFQS